MAVPMAIHRKHDWSILEKLRLEVAPVGIKYLSKLPQGSAKLDEKIALCEMLKSAFHGYSFYAAAKNHACEAGLYVLGQTELAKQYHSGEFGAELGVFRDKRAARRLYEYIPRMAKRAAKYIAFSPLAQMTCDPDIVIILADTTQAEILLRAMSYGTGNMWHSRYSSAIGCAWLFIYPYVNGEINFIPTGLGFGMRRRKLFPEGRQFISIPTNQLPYILRTLQEMPWVPRPYQPDGPEYVKSLRIKLGLDRA
jgi:uncharacterized protein (DUF169 family)